MKYDDETRTERISKNLTALVLYCLKSKINQKREYGENISIYKEVKIAFDGYSENEDESEEKRRQSESYAIYIPKNCLEDAFIFPEHETSSFGIVHRRGKEVYFNTWFDKTTQTLDLEGYLVNDRIQDAGLGTLEIDEIVEELVQRYGLNDINNIANASLNIDKTGFYYTILVSMEYIDYERSGNIPGTNEIRKCAELIWEKAAKAVLAFKQLSRRVDSVFVGIWPDYSKLYPLNFSILRGSKDANVDKKQLLAFIECAKDVLSSTWPDEIERISLTFRFNDDQGIANNESLLQFSAKASIDCEAMCKDTQTGLLFMQGYENGDYDTGFISSDYGDDTYLLTSSYNREFLNLQTPITIEERLVSCP